MLFYSDLAHGGNVHVARECAVVCLLIRLDSPVFGLATARKRTLLNVVEKTHILLIYIITL